MHVLVIPAWYPLRPDDLNGCFFREQAIALHKHGCKVGVIYPALRSLRNWRTVFVGKRGYEIESDEGVATHRLHGVDWFPRMPAASTPRWVRLGLHLYKQYVAIHGKPDVIHAHSILNGGVLASRIKQLHGVPFVVTEHSTTFARGLLTHKQVQIARDAVKTADRKYAVSHEFAVLLNQLLAQGESEWQVMPNIVNQKFLDFPLKIASKQNEFNFVNIALMDDKKKQANIVEAFAAKFKNSPNVTLTIGGDGPEMATLVALAAKHGVSGRILFPGMLTREQVMERVAAADAFVLASRYETFGVVVIEALALGKPVVATRCGGPESIVREQDGLLVPIDDVPSLGAAMQSMYENRNAYDANEIRLACSDRYSERAVAERLIQEYKNITSR